MTAEDSSMQRVRIECEVRDGVGRIAYIFSSSCFEQLLQTLGVTVAEEIPEKWIRLIANHESIEEAFTRFGTSETASTAIILPSGNENSEEGMYINEHDVGFDMLRRLAPELTEQEKLLLDPQFSPINFELRVYNDGEPLRNVAQVGRCVLQKTLHPPNLAQ